jgi:transcriptional regulator with XRE-family HTH domain
MEVEMSETGDTLPSAVGIHVGYRLRTLRLARGRSQHDLGQRLGLSADQIQAYETGANRVSANHLMRLSEIFGTEPTSFFEGLAGPSITTSSGHPEDFDRLAFSTPAESISVVKAFASGTRSFGG